MAAAPMAMKAAPEQSPHARRPRNGALELVPSPLPSRLAHRRQKVRGKPLLLLPDKFSCLVVDPPWPMQKIEREVRPTRVGFD